MHANVYIVADGSSGFIPMIWQIVGNMYFHLSFNRGFNKWKQVYIWMYCMRYWQEQ